METIDELCLQVNDLFKEHEETRFPKISLKTDKANDLVYLDSTLTGCVSTFLKKGCTLDIGRVVSLGLCYRAVSLLLVSDDLLDEAIPYFARLEKLAAKTLWVVGAKAGPFP